MALMHSERTHGDYGMTISDVKGNKMSIDIPEEQGGTGKGLRPMQTVLAALCGCSSADVVSILKKQRQDLKTLTIDIDGEREQGKEPSLWTTVDVSFIMTGELDPAKAYRAADLSINKYCSVAETLRRAGASISFRVIVNGEAVNIS
jgi:putative redox protein